MVSEFVFILSSMYDVLNLRHSGDSRMTVIFDHFLPELERRVLDVEHQWLRWPGQFCRPTVRSMDPGCHSVWEVNTSNISYIFQYICARWHHIVSFVFISRQTNIFTLKEHILKKIEPAAKGTIPPWLYLQTYNHVQFINISNPTSQSTASR